MSQIIYLLELSIAQINFNVSLFDKKLVLTLKGFILKFETLFLFYNRIIIMKKIIFLVLNFSLLLIAARAEDLTKKMPESPAANDRFIAEYLATKNIIYIRNMFISYDKVSEDVLKDARRFSYLYLEINKPNSPRAKQKKEIVLNFFNKYGCPAQTPQCTKFYTIASGMWALDSLSRQDEAIKNEVNHFLSTHKKMNDVYESEHKMYSYYLLLVMISIAQPEKWENYLSLYEKSLPLNVADIENKLKEK